MFELDKIGKTKRFRLVLLSLKVDFYVAPKNNCSNDFCSNEFCSYKFCSNKFCSDKFCSNELFSDID
jgi:hypothetical protein